MTTDFDVHDIDKIEFGIFSPEEIRGMAVCKIDNSKEMAGPGSVYDERMGPIGDTNEKCVTCGLGRECWGHFGYIDLEEPMLHPMFYKIISVFLKCFCKQCYRLLVMKEQIEIDGWNKASGVKKFTHMIEKLKKIDICSHCSAPQPKITYKSKDMTISMEYKQKKGDGNAKVSIVLGVEDIKEIFDNILDEDVRLLGLDPTRTKPKNLVLTVLPVIPPCSRPYVVSDGNICDDDLTYQLIEILKINNQLAKAEDMSEQKRQKLIQSLRFRVTTSMNNSKGKAKHPTDSRPLKGYKERLAGKGGRLRNNLMGKRVDFSSRSVIGADPTLKLDEVCIPREVAQIHTIPETVTPYNIDLLTKMVNTGKANFIITQKNNNGKLDPTGAKTKINLQYGMYRRGTELLYGDIIIRKNTEINKDKKGNIIIPKNKKGYVSVVTGTEKLQEGDILLRNGKITEAKRPVKRDIVLKIGDIVETQLQNGAYVIMNRQPTLHKGSMHALKVVIRDHKSFRLNLGCTRNLNADFDGDEMNLHTPQSYEASVEIEMLSSPVENIMSAQESKNGICVIQDALIACFMMSKDNEPLSRNQFNDITTCGERPDGSSLWNPEKIKNIERVLKQFGKKPVVYNGRGLLSLLFPDDLYYENKNGACPEEPVVRIHKGVLVEGVFDKNIIGKAHNSLIQILNKEYGGKIAANFIDNIHFIGNAWMSVHGFSVGLLDCLVTSDQITASINGTLALCYAKAEGIENVTQNPGIREVRVMGALNQAKDAGMRISKNGLDPKNNFLTTINSGAKGDFFNLGQITSALGQQHKDGQRINPQCNHGTRTLPHYPFGQLSKEREYESRGFIRNSFIHGLEPEEFFFHAISGREGIIDTALGTAQTGYLQRRMVKSMEDIITQSDGTVRDTSNKVYQNCYGKSGFDMTKTVLVDGEQQFCNVDRLVNRLNNLDEKDLITENNKPDLFMNQPRVISTFVSGKIDKDVEKQKLVDKIRTNYPDSVVNEDWTMKELRQRLQSLEINDETDNEENVEKEDTEEEDEESVEESEEELEDEFVDDEDGNYDGDDFASADFGD